MALRWADRILETSVSTGTGAFTLAGAITGYRRFADIPSIATNDTVYYAIFAVDANGNPSGDWETGLGTYSSANTLTRTTVISSTNANAAVSFAAGSKYVMACPVSSNMDLIGAAMGASQGDTLFRNATGWTRLAAGTAGQFLKTQGAGANPLWATPGAGEGGTGWSTVHSSTISGSVASVAITGLANYADLVVVGRGLTASGSGQRALQVSVDNGASYFTTSGDYQLVSSAGVESATDAFAFHATSSALARTLVCHVANMRGAVKMCHNYNSSFIQTLFVASASDINAIRLIAGGGANLTGGTVLVMAR